MEACQTFSWCPILFYRMVKRQELVSIDAEVDSGSDY